jgi:hypothetical protein
VTPITTDRYLMPGGELDGDWQIVAQGERGDWVWSPEWNRAGLTWFWERVQAGSIYAVQGRTPGSQQDCFTLYARLASHVVAKRRAA